MTMVMGQNLSMMLVHTYTIFRGSIPISPNYFRVYLLTPTGTNWLTPIWVTSEHFAKHQPTFLVRLAASKRQREWFKMTGPFNSRSFEQQTWCLCWSFEGLQLHSCMKFNFHLPPAKPYLDLRSTKQAHLFFDSSHRAVYLAARPDVSVSKQGGGVS